MKVQEYYWKTTDGLKLFGQYWTPDNDIKGVICLVHGMGEHIGRFHDFAEFMAQAGYATIGFDHRGHGKSEGKRGHTPSYELLLDGVAGLLNKADEVFPGKQQVLYGHSMGGNVVANYVLKRKPVIAGVVMSSPWLKLAFDPPAIQLKLGKLVNSIFPGFTQSTKLDVDAISRVPEEVKKYQNDPLVHDKISTTFFLSVHDQGLWALEHASEFPLPLLIFHGSADKLTSAPASQEFAGKIKKNVTLKIFEGAYHETHNDTTRLEVYTLVKNWLDATIKP